jgi:hypothetical protein
MYRSWRPRPACRRGTITSARSGLVICNGGSLTTNQALALGVPVLGLVTNLDQHLNMQGVCGTGPGAVLRAERACGRDIREVVVRRALKSLVHWPILLTGNACMVLRIE